MKVTADTNLLVRAFVDDDPRQAELARRELANADAVAVTAPVLCELVWVLGRGYRLSRDEIAAAMRALIGVQNVSLDRPAVEAGLIQLDEGGDFADGVIAFEGRRLGCDQFLSFDKLAVELMLARGAPARLLR